MAKLLAMMLLSASLSGAQAAPGTEQIVIGASLPLTGSEAKAGARVRDGYQLAVDEVMRAGGLKVGNQRLPIRLELLDDATDKQRAAQLVGELVQKRHANFLLGSFTSPLVEAQAAAADRLQVPYVAASGSATSIYQRGYRYVFSLSAPTGQMGNSLMRFVDDQQRAGKLGSPLRIALAWENTSHGKDYRAAILDYTGNTAVRRHDFQVVLDESFELKTKDFTPLLSRIKAAGADALLVDAHLEEYLAMQKQYLAMGMCHQVLSYGARGPEKEARETLPHGGTDYVLSAVWWNAQLTSNPLSKAFVEAFRAKHGRMPEWYEALAYEAARALFQAIQRAGSTDRDAVRDALAALKIESILPGGYLAFPEQYGHQARYLFVVQQNMPEGGAPIVYPRIAANQEGVVPNPRCGRAASSGAK